MSKTRNTIHREIIEKKSELVTKIIARDIEKHEAEEIDILMEECENIEIPKQLHNKLIELINIEMAQQRKQKRKTRINKAFKLCACFFIVCLFMGAFLMTNVEAFRAKVYELFLSENTSYTEIIPIEIPYDSNHIIPEDWDSFWYPSYMPEGFELSAVKKIGTMQTLFFKKDEVIISIGVDEINGSKLLVDNDKNVERKEIEMSMGKGYYIQREDKEVLVWENKDNLFSIIADQLSIETLESIAEGMQYNINNNK